MDGNGPIPAVHPAPPDRSQKRGDNHTKPMASQNLNDIRDGQKTLYEMFEGDAEPVLQHPTLDKDTAEKVFQYFVADSTISRKQREWVRVCLRRYCGL